MSVVVTVQHPAHVHFFRHAVAELRRRGTAVHVFAREKEVTTDLLDAYGIDHEVLAGTPASLPLLPSGSGGAGSLAALAAVQAVYEARLLRRARRIRPDVVAAIGGVAASHVAAAVGCRSVVFYDTEHAGLIRRLAFPLADEVCTPACFRDDLGPKQVRYPGYHELAYLHPDRFEPDPGVPASLGLGPDDRYAVVRLVDWTASHDAGQGGFDDVRDAVARLSATGAEVLLSAEGSLPADLEAHRASVAPHRIHDLLAYADCFVGEGATMAAESAVLGTPAVYVNTLSMGYTDDLESRYGLLFGFDSPDRHARALDRATAILAADDRETWRRRRARLLEKTVDATDVVVDRLLTAVDPVGPGPAVADGSGDPVDGDAGRYGDPDAGAADGADDRDAGGPGSTRPGGGAP